MPIVLQANEVSARCAVQALVSGTQPRDFMDQRCQVLELALKMRSTSQTQFWKSVRIINDST